ncbi:MAG: ABC transporter ATP-binding protein [Rhodospirillaceae bacterium]|nr:ABC transporter ATP-binding protein [Rhodospirillaceae bacterium]|tara:strand:- start:172 stop:876 length:705 start_codon:yes stop_codon:yes gene_type:complete
MLAVSGLKTAYGRIPILHGIDLNVAEGEFVGILGHNGMGKTTLLKALIGLLRPTDGTIELNGQNITRMPAYKRNLSGVGYVPQGRDIFPNLSVVDNLKIAMAMHKVDEEKVLEEVLETFPRLKPLLDRAGRVLSGGEQQILALARCLCGGPSLLLLDEPTEGIQPSIVEEIIEILHSLRTSRNLTIVLVEQNLDFIASLSQRVHIIQRGQLVNEVSPDQLSDPDLVREFVGMGG